MGSLYGIWLIMSQKFWIFSLPVLTLLCQKITDIGWNFLNMLNSSFCKLYWLERTMISAYKAQAFFLSTPSFFWFSNVGSSDTEKYLLPPWCWAVLPWRSSCWSWLIPFVSSFLTQVLYLGLCSNYVPWWLLNGYSCYLCQEKSGKRLDSLTP